MANFFSFGACFSVAAAEADVDKMRTFYLVMRKSKACLLYYFLLTKNKLNSLLS
jgi:hypothetical protein